MSSPVTAPVTAPATPSDISAPPEHRHTIIGDLREIAGELSRSRDLIHQLTLRDIKIRYKQAAFGFAWALLVPMAVVLAGMAVRVAMAMMAGKNFDRLQIAGMAIRSVPWAFFVGCVNMTTPSLVGNMGLVTKVYFPREVLPLGAVLAQTFDSGIGAGIVIVVLPFLGVTWSLQMLWAPLLLALLWTQALGIGLFLSCANIFFRDVKYLVQVVLTFGIFITPVIFDASMFGPKGCPIMMLNPLAPVLEGLRLSVVLQHNLEPMIAPKGDFVAWHPWYLAYACAWAFGGLIFSAILFHRSERRFAELA